MFVLAHLEKLSHRNTSHIGSELCLSKCAPILPYGRIGLYCLTMWRMGCGGDSGGGGDGGGGDGGGGGSGSGDGSGGARQDVGRGYVILCQDHSEAFL